MSAKDMLKGAALWVIIPLATGAAGFYALGPTISKMTAPANEQVADVPPVSPEASAPVPRDAPASQNESNAPAPSAKAGGDPPAVPQSSSTKEPDVQVSVERANGTGKKTHSSRRNSAPADSASTTAPNPPDGAPSTDAAATADPTIGTPPLDSGSSETTPPATKPKKPKKKKKAPAGTDVPVHEPAAGEKGDPASAAGAGAGTIGH